MAQVTHRHRRAVAALMGAVTLVGCLFAAGIAAAAPARRSIAGTHPAWAVSSRRASAQTPTAGPVNARVWLAGQDPAGLAAYATAVSTPGSAQYGNYLSPTDVAARYGATTAQIDGLKAWLTTSGLTITGVKTGIGGYLAVTGSVADAAKAFSVSFGAFNGPDGKTDRAPEQGASAPASVAAAVLTVSGLDTATHRMRPLDTLPPPGPNYWVAPPTSDFWGQKMASTAPPAYGGTQPWVIGGYTPRQIRGAYGVSSTRLTGRGQTVAVVDAFASPTMRQDANQYARVTGDQPLRGNQYKEYLSPTWSYTNECDAPGWYAEQTLDVESAHGQAPDAKIRYVGAASCTDPDLADALAFIVTHHLASIVSNSWGEPSDQSTMTGVFDQIFQAGAAEGIGFYFSSGDNGYESPAQSPGLSDKRQVDYPTSSPWVTSVGGTSLAIGPQNNYQFETSWGTLSDPLSADGQSWKYPPPGLYPDNYGGSSGGGVSTDYAEPFYQRGVVPQSLATQLPDGTKSQTPMRVVPDVSALGDPGTGFLVGQTTLQPDGKTYAFSLSRIGGTSLSSPTFAGIEADAQQAAGRPLGFADPAIYRRAPAFRDVTDDPFHSGVPPAEVRNNYKDPYTKQGPLVTLLRTLGVDGQGADALPAVPGYDDATGIGSPTADYLRSFGR